MSFDDMILADLAAPQKNAIVGGPFGSNLVSKDYVAGGVPVIRGANMGAKWIGGDFVYVSNNKAIELSQNLARPYDLVFTQRGTLGQVAIVPDHSYDRYVVSQSQMKITVDPKKADVHFLYYLFSSPHQLQYIRNSAIQTGVPHTNLGILKKTPVRIPPLAVQREVASILSALDDRIALLRDTNATLEAIAQALFKSWFMDFDPVRAKQEGRTPEGMDEATAALFPDSFEESEQGLMPRGWKDGALGDVADTTRSQIQPEAMSVELLYVGLEHIPRQSLGLDSWGTAEGLGSAKSCFTKGDILFGKLRPYFHKVAIAPFAGVCSTDILVCKAKVHGYYSFTAMHLFSSELIAYAERLSNGAKMPRVSWKDLAAYKLVVPPTALATAFDEITLPMLVKITANVLEASKLTALRDTLLPRLISGQLRLPDGVGLAEQLYTGA